MLDSVHTSFLPPSVQVGGVSYGVSGVCAVGEEGRWLRRVWRGEGGGGVSALRRVWWGLSPADRFTFSKPAPQMYELLK